MRESSDKSEHSIGYSHRGPSPWLIARPASTVLHVFAPAPPLPKLTPSVPLEPHRGEPHRGDTALKPADKHVQPRTAMDPAHLNRKHHWPWGTLANANTGWVSRQAQSPPRSLGTQHPENTERHVQLSKAMSPARLSPTRQGCVPKLPSREGCVPKLPSFGVRRLVAAFLFRTRSNAEQPCSVRTDSERKLRQVGALHRVLPSGCFAGHSQKRIGCEHRRRLRLASRDCGNTRRGTITRPGDRRRGDRASYLPRPAVTGLNRRLLTAKSLTATTPSSQDDGVESPVAR